jgi:hypothetical protein
MFAGRCTGFGARPLPIVWGLTTIVKYVFAVLCTRFSSSSGLITLARAPQLRTLLNVVQPEPHPRTTLGQLGKVLEGMPFSVPH